MHLWVPTLRNSSQNFSHGSILTFFNRKWIPSYQTDGTVLGAATLYAKRCNAIQTVRGQVLFGAGILFNMISSILQLYSEYMTGWYIQAGATFKYLGLQYWNFPCLWQSYSYQEHFHLECYLDKRIQAAHAGNENWPIWIVRPSQIFQCCWYPIKQELIWDTFDTCTWSL